MRLRKKLKKINGQNNVKDDKVKVQFCHLNNKKLLCTSKVRDYKLDSLKCEQKVLFGSLKYFAYQFFRILYTGYGKKVTIYGFEFVYENR